MLQSFADGLKVFLAGNHHPERVEPRTVPDRANHHLHRRVDGVGGYSLFRRCGAFEYQCRPALRILAISSLGVYGIIIAGWASNSKYPFYSAMRAAAQMISYEVSIGFILICVVLWAGTFNIGEIVAGQKGHIFGFINAYGLNPLLFPIAVMFLISSMAETARAPFDLTEAESEMVAGYQTEYSSMAFALFWLGEYANVLADVRAQRDPVLGRDTCRRSTGRRFMPCRGYSGSLARSC